MKPKKKLNLNAPHFSPSRALLLLNSEYQSKGLNQYSKDQNIIIDNVAVKPIINHNQSNRQKSPQQKQKKKTQNVQQIKKEQQVQEPPEEPKLILDPKLGYWTYTQQEYMEFNNKLKQYQEQKLKFDEKLKEQRMLEQRKRMNKFAKLKEKREKRNNLLGMKKINQIIRELRIQHNKFIRKEKKKHFGYELDENNNVQIIEQEKKKKLSKIKKAKQQWENMNDTDYETVDEDNKQQSFFIKNLLEQMASTNKLAGEKYNNMTIRPWIDQIPCKELDDLTLQLINELSFMQAKKKVIEPKKFKKRIVSGMKECLRSISYTLQEKSAKLIIIPINIQEYPIKNGPDHQILKVIKQCLLKNIPIIYASNRSKLGRAFSGKFGPKISVISIINYKNAEEQFNHILQVAQEQREAFRQVYGQVNIEQMIELI